MEFLMEDFDINSNIDILIFTVEVVKDENFVKILWIMVSWFFNLCTIDREEYFEMVRK